MKLRVRPLARITQHQASARGLEMIYAVRRQLALRLPRVQCVVPSVPPGRSQVDYHEVVTNPMDMLRIHQKIKTEEYAHVDQMASDVELMVANTKAYYKASLFCLPTGCGDLCSSSRSHCSCQSNAAAFCFATVSQKGSRASPWVLLVSVTTDRARSNSPSFFWWALFDVQII